ncbi:hypothetical protein ABEW00_17440 [Rossellomorea vietnamensis]|uniref:hypothetical protein n=1 Tax=Rossellomorea vietnamensis TaxID=218284 RepID=UPI003D2AEA30
MTIIIDPKARKHPNGHGESGFILLALFACGLPMKIYEKTIELYDIKKAAVDYLMSAANANTYHSEILSTYIEESNRKMSNLRPLMMEGLQKADLRYRIEQDGTLTYG